MKGLSARITAIRQALHESGALVRILEKGQGPGRDQVHRGFVTRGDQQRVVRPAGNNHQRDEEHALVIAIGDRIEKSAESGAEGEYGEPEDEEGDWNTEEGEDQASDQQNSEPDLPARKPEGASLSKTTSSPWNAVCVISLRVFSKNNEVTLKLVGPQNMDGAALDADEIIAGVTM